MRVHRLWRGMAAGVALVSGGFAAERAAAQKAPGGVTIPDSVRGLSNLLVGQAPLDRHSGFSCLVRPIVKAGEVRPVSTRKLARGRTKSAKVLHAAAVRARRPRGDSR